MAVVLSPPNLQFFDNNGDPLAGGFVYTYAAGTNTPKATYTDAGGLTANSNPVVLDAAGRPEPAGMIWIDGAYKFVVQNSAGVQVGDPIDNVSSFNVSGSNINALLPSQTGNAGKSLITDGSNVSWGYSGPQISAFQGVRLYGLTLANNTTDATNDIDITAGACVSDDGTTVMMLSSTYTKQVDAAWAVGTGAGGLDTGAVGNNTYHVWVIKRTDTNITDVLFSLSATSPTMPTNYTKKKRVGAILRETAINVPFLQYDKKFKRKTPLQVINTTSSTSAALVDVKVPSGIKVEALLGTSIDAPSTGVVLYYSDPDAVDVAPTLTNGVVSVASGNAAGGGESSTVTNTSSQIRWRTSSARLTYATSLGWVDYQI